MENDRAAVKAAEREVYDCLPVSWFIYLKHVHPKARLQEKKIKNKTRLRDWQSQSRRHCTINSCFPRSYAHPRRVSPVTAFLGSEPMAGAAAIICWHLIENLDDTSMHHLLSEDSPAFTEAKNLEINLSSGFQNLFLLWVQNSFFLPNL